MVQYGCYLFCPDIAYRGVIFVAIFHLRMTLQAAVYLFKNVCTLPPFVTNEFPYKKIKAFRHSI